MATSLTMGMGGTPLWQSPVWSPKPIMLSSSTVSNGEGGGLPPIPGARPLLPSLPSMLPPRKGVKMSDIIQHRGFPGQSNVIGPDGRKLSNDAAMNLGPLSHQGWNTSGVGPGSPGYRGSGVIGSAAGAVGSPGMPTSVRGRMEKYGPYAAAMPTWQAARVGGTGMFGGGLKDLYNMNRPAPMPAPVPARPVTAQPAAQPQTAPAAVNIPSDLNAPSTQSVVQSQAGMTSQPTSAVGFSGNNMVTQPSGPLAGNFSGQSPLFNIPGMPQQSSGINLLTLLNQIRR